MFLLRSRHGQGFPPWLCTVLLHFCSSVFKRCACSLQPASRLEPVQCMRLSLWKAEGPRMLISLCRQAKLILACLIPSCKWSMYPVRPMGVSCVYNEHPCDCFHSIHNLSPKNASLSYLHGITQLDYRYVEQMHGKQVRFARFREVMSRRVL